MGDRAQLSGIAYDIAKKVAANRDTDAEGKAVDWMTQVVGKAPPAGSYEDSLKNGVYLCELINAIHPGSVKKIHQKGQAFTVMQNIEAFQKALAAYGVPSEDLFQTVDLWEKRNIPAVTKTIFALARTVYVLRMGGCKILLERNGWARVDVYSSILQLMPMDKAQAKGWSGPELGPKMAIKNEREFTDEQIRAGRDGHIGLQAGFNKGATQSGINMGNARHIID